MPCIRIYDTKKRDFESSDFQEVLRVQILMKNLQDRGQDVRLINRIREPEDFEKEKAVADLYREQGDRAFPCMTLDGRPVLTGRYPGDDQVLGLLGCHVDLFGTDHPEGGCAACGKCGGHC